MSRNVVMAAAAALLCAVAAQAADEPATIVYTHVNLIDGTGAGPKPDMAIVTKGERIDAIVPMSDAGKFGGTQRDMAGAYALPGLINTHVHLATYPNRVFAHALLRRDVYGGITAVRDMAGDARLLADLSRDAQQKEIPSPDVFFAALMAGPEFFHDERTVSSALGAKPGAVPWMQAITDKTNMPLAIAAARGTSATAIKIYADLSGSLVRSIAEEAHRQGMQVWAHGAVFPASPREGIDAGVDVASHVCMLAYQVSQKIPREYHNRAPVDEARVNAQSAVLSDLYADMKRRGTILDATLWVYDVMWRISNPQPPPYCTLALAGKLAADAHRAGVEISAGTDAEAEWDKPYSDLYKELGLLVERAKLTPLEAIRSATLVGAKALGQEENMGTLAPGKYANIAFTKKNPADDIANIATVVSTVKRGTEYRRRDYKPITKDEAKGEY